MAPPRSLPARAFCVLAAALTGACGGGGGSRAFAITSVPPTSVEIRAPYAYAVEVANAGGAPVAYLLAQGPSGMTVSPAGLVEWAPAYADLGTHAVRIAATAAGSTAVQAWSLRVHQDVLLGVTLSPRGHTTSSTAQDWTDHFAGHAPYGRVIGFHSAWRTSVADDGEIPPLALTAMAGAAQHGYVPVVGFGWSDGAGNPDLASESEPANESWTNAETRAEFLAMVSAFSAQHRPPFLFLGNETNSYFVGHSQAEWDAWTSELSSCCDAVHAASPGTVVFTTFQHEKLKGLGARAGWSFSPQWGLLDEVSALGKLDAVGFTSYPYLEHGSPADVPDGFYDEISAHWAGPVLFTEIGWLSQPSGPYGGGEADQAAFVPRFFALTSALPLRGAVWLFLHDWDGQSSIPSVVGIGLRDNLATSLRPSDAAWRAEVVLREP